MLQNSCKTLGLKKNMVYKIPPGGRGGGGGMGCRFSIFSLFMDIHNSFMDIQKSFMDIHKSFMDIHK